jgi:endonuclease/exonuclease/phosphatase family metal-dependent hydrolase
MTQPRSRNFLFVLSMGLLWAASVHAQNVVSWNLEWFPGRKAEIRDPAVITQHMAAAQTTLARIQPDVFVGLEIRDREVFGELVSAVTGLHVAVVSAFRDDDGSLDHQQIGIATRYPIHAAWAEPWVPTMARLPRGFAVAAVREPRTGKLLVVYGVHLKSNRAVSARETKLNICMRNESAHQLVHDVDELRRLVFPEKDVFGWVIAGDFNTNHDGQFEDVAIQTLEKAGFYNSWSSVPKEKRLTWRGDEKFPGTTFDYIMTFGLGTPRARLVEAPPETGDHLPVLVRWDASAP